MTRDNHQGPSVFFSSRNLNSPPKNFLSISFIKTLYVCTKRNADRDRRGIDDRSSDFKSLVLLRSSRKNRACASAGQEKHDPIGGPRDRRIVCATIALTWKSSKGGKGDVMRLETVLRYNAAEDRSEVDAWKTCIKISVGLNVGRFPRHKLCFFGDRWSTALTTDSGLIIYRHRP